MIHSFQDKYRTMVSRPAKYMMVMDDLVNQIRQGKIPHGAQLPSNRELMMQYHVSYATISRAIEKLDETGLIDRKWGKGIYIRPQTDVFSNIAIIFNDFYQATHPFMTPIIEAIDKSGLQYNWHANIFALRQGSIFTRNRKTLLEILLQENSLHGVIACSPHSPEEINKLHAMGMPVVSISNVYPDSMVASVMPDIIDGAKQIATHLQELGHKRIALILGSKNEYSAKLVRSTTMLGEVLKQELSARGMGRPFILHSEFKWDTISNQIYQLLTSKDRPTAIVFGDDIIAFKTFDLALSLGLDIPRQLSIVSWGDVLHDKTITSVQVPLEEMGQKAVELLHCLSEGVMATADNRIIVPVKLIRRKSS